MDMAKLAEMMRATLSEDKTERDAAEEQLKQVKQYTPCAFGKICKNLTIHRRKYGKFIAILLNAIKFIVVNTIFG